MEEIDFLTKDMALEKWMRGRCILVARLIGAGF
jgi:hypothetical protein